MGSTLSERSSDNLFDFLLNFTFAGSALDGVECAKREEIDESRTAMARVIFPGFICIVFRQRQMKDVWSFSLFTHEDADARQSRPIQMRR